MGIERDSLKSWWGESAYATRECEGTLVRVGGEGKGQEGRGRVTAIMDAIWLETDGILVACENFQKYED